MNKEDPNTPPPLPFSRYWRRPLQVTAFVITIPALTWFLYDPIPTALMSILVLLAAGWYCSFRMFRVPELAKFEQLTDRDRAWKEAVQAINSRTTVWRHLALIISMCVTITLLNRALAFALPNVSRKSYNEVVPMIVLSLGFSCLLHVRAGRIRRELRRMLVERGHDLCIPCGYDLTGNVSGVCPECGTTIPSNEGNDVGQE